MWRPSTDSRLKVKHSEYVRLHRLIYGVNERHVWDVLANGDDLSAAFQGAPDESHEWVRGVSSRLTKDFQQRKQRAEQAYREVCAELPESFSRKEFAAAAVRRPEKPLLFLYDGRSIDEPLWNAVRPSGGGRQCEWRTATLTDGINSSLACLHR